MRASVRADSAPGPGLASRHDDDASRRVPLGRCRPPRTRSRAATGTTTGGRGSTRPNTPCVEVSGDCCDSLQPLRRRHRARARSRIRRRTASRSSGRGIEPEDGEFSRAALDYYRRMLATCHEHGVAPVVTFHHFTTPAVDGRRVAAGHEPEIVDKFARFCEKSVGAPRRPRSRWAARSTSRTSCRCSAT